MTTGEKLVEMSELLTGTAMEHLLNITGGGGGTEYVFVDAILKAELGEELSPVCSVNEDIIICGMEESIDLGSINEEIINAIIK